MTPRPPKDAKSKLKQQFYSVSMKTAPRSRKKDHSAATEKKIEEIKALAASQGLEDEVSIQSEDQTLSSLGIFFMQAPEKFAEKVKKLEGIGQVTKPARKKAKKPRRR